MRLGKEVADNRVEQSLYQRAVGYEHEVVKVFMPAGASEPVHANYRETIEPDVSAAIFWLKNRCPQAWRDRQQLEHAGVNGGLLEIADRQEAISAMLAELRLAKCNGDLMIEHKPANGRDLL